jgi:lipopolysaccharide biosynthesis protein
MAPVTVFVHVHYPDIWLDMSRLLSERLTIPFRLVLTSSLPATEITIPRASSLLSVSFFQVENRGRDILPFLRALAETQDFEIGLKLHTKKSPQREDGALWRAEILDSLLPLNPALTTIVEHMQADQRMGFVAPGGFCLSVGPWILQNAVGLNRVASVLGISVDEHDLHNVFFAAGSMFWFRRSALAALTIPALMLLFESEEGQQDGTTAHAIERLFPVEARRQGYVSLAVSALMACKPGMSLAELQELARDHADIPNRYFPGPNVPALPLMPRSEVAALQHLTDRLATLYRSIVPEAVRVSLRRLMRQVSF